MKAKPSQNIAQRARQAAPLRFVRLTNRQKLAVTLALFFVATPGETLGQQARRTARMGSLQITVASAEQLRAPGESIGGARAEGSVVRIELRLRNAGRQPVCAESVARLKVAEESGRTRDYAGMGESWRVRDLAPREELTKKYEFAVAGMPAPIELLIEQASEAQSCSEAPAKRRAASRRAVRLSLEGLLGRRPNKPS